MWMWGYSVQHGPHLRSFQSSRAVSSSVGTHLCTAQYPLRVRLKRRPLTCIEAQLLKRASSSRHFWNNSQCQLLLKLLDILGPQYVASFVDTKLHELHTPNMGRRKPLPSEHLPPVVVLARLSVCSVEAPGVQLAVSSTFRLEQSP